VGILATTDPDPNDTFSYALLDSADGRFAIQGNQLVVADAARLDYEANTSHAVRVQTTDAGGNRLAQDFTVTVTNLNEAPTTLLCSDTRVAENSLDGTLLGTLSTVDPDANERFTYKLLDDASGRFRIVGNALYVANGSALNYEADTSHVISVQTTDAGRNRLTVKFTITVTDRNERPTNLTLSGVTVPGAATDTFVVGTLATTDPDRGDTCTYSLVDDAAGRFTLDGDQLLIHGYTPGTGYWIAVRTTDAGGLSLQKSFIITVTGDGSGDGTGVIVVGQSPAAIELSGHTVAEQSAAGTLVGTLSTTGGDAGGDAGDTFTYTLLDSAGGRFKIEGDQLLVDDGTLLDYETATSHVIRVQATDAAGLSCETELTISVTDVQATVAVALFDPSTSSFQLLRENTTGAAQDTFAYGVPDAGWTTLVGDWNGDGTSDVGLYDASTSTFYLTSARVSGVAEYTFGYGVPNAGWEPLVGDWNGDGQAGVGLYDPHSSCFYLTDTLSTGMAETTFGYGVPDADWQPLVGDWNGDGQTSVGLYDPHSSCFYLADTLTTGYANYAFGYGVPDAGWTPLVGDWNGDGATGVGLYDTSGSTFYLTDTLSTGTAETTFGYGVPGAGWRPLVGDWNGDGAAGVGLYDTADATFFLSDHPATGVAEYTVEIANASASAIPLVGAWTEAPTAAAVDQLDLAELANAELEPPLAELLSGR
jgi:VCBS repeat-containing protein